MSEWIKCSERMPGLDFDNFDISEFDYLYNYRRSERVMIAWDNLTSKSVKIGFFVRAIRSKSNSRHEQWVELDQGGSISIEKVTHWMPLPSPPTEEPKK